MPNQYLKTRTEYWTPEKWDDGFVNSRGYFMVYRPDHPGASQAGWVHRHRAVWWLETGENPIEQGYEIHHRDESKQNDTFTNLIKIEPGNHQRGHKAKEVQCICEVCGDEFYLPKWRVNQGRGRFCSRSCGMVGAWKLRRA